MQRESKQYFGALCLEINWLSQSWFQAQLWLQPVTLQMHTWASKFTWLIPTLIPQLSIRMLYLRSKHFLHDKSEKTKKWIDCNSEDEFISHGNLPAKIITSASIYTLITNRSHRGGVVRVVKLTETDLSGRARGNFIFFFYGDSRWACHWVERVAETFSSHRALRSFP